MSWYRLLFAHDELTCSEGGGQPLKAFLLQLRGSAAAPSRSLNTATTAGLITHVYKNLVVYMWLQHGQLMILALPMKDRC